MTKLSVMMLTLIILATLLVPKIPKVSSSTFLNGTWSSWLVVWLGGLYNLPNPYIGPFPNPPPGFPGPGDGWYFAGTLSGSWTATLSGNQLNLMLSGTFSGSSSPLGFFDMPTVSWLAPGSTSISGPGIFTVTQVGTVVSGSASGTFGGPDLTGTWLADITIDTSLGGQGTITFHPTWIGSPPVYIWPHVEWWTGGAFGYPTPDSTEWLWGEGTFISREKTTSSISGPIYKEEALVPGDFFPIEIVVDDIEKLWGYQFTLSYDTSVLTAMNWESLGIFSIPGPGEINDALGYVTLSANSYFGDPNGLTSSDPVGIARIYFVLDAEGWSRLDLHDELLINIYGEPMFVGVVGGGFASVDVADLKGRGAWPEVRHFKLSEQPDSIDTLYARVATNTTGTPVNVKAVFTIHDELGIPIGTIETGTATLPELSETILTADFDTTAWVMAGKVLIGARAYYDINGDSIMDFAGPKIKSFSIKISP